MSHTLGPWYVLGTAHPELTIFTDEWKKAHRATVISVLPKAYLKITVDRTGDSGDPLPDAHLVAAAPDLLAALRRLHNPENCGDHCSNSCPQCQAATAIAKAEGRTP